MRQEQLSFAICELLRIRGCWRAIPLTGGAVGRHRLGRFGNAPATLPLGTESPQATTAAAVDLGGCGAFRLQNFHATERAV